MASVGVRLIRGWFVENVPKQAPRQHQQTPPIRGHTRPSRRGRTADFRFCVEQQTDRVWMEKMALFLLDSLSRREERILPQGGLVTRCLS